MLPRSFRGRSGILFGIPVFLLFCAAVERVESAEPVVAARPNDSPRHPNIVWITCEDTSPQLGCYGDRKAITPRLDKFASEGTRYANAFSVAGVCAPSRSCLITGMYPTSIGSQHMRSRAVLPEMIRCFPEYLRQAGYYCTNNSKTDYNFDHDPKTWDESSPKAHWRNRKAGQPFFAVFNIMTTHESKIRADEKEFMQLTAALTQEQRQDPSKLDLPPYYPDTPAVRREWARYYELVTAMDRQAGRILDELEKDGLATDTIVFFFSDHGVGLPRAKRWLYDSGIRVPLIVRWPGRVKSGAVERRLVSFVDFAPTILSLANEPIPKHLQGKAFLGKQAEDPRCYVYAARDRMDERYDLIRAVRDARYKYIRNYQPDRPYAQYLNYAEIGSTMKEFRRLNAAGLLVDPPKLFMRSRKPAEELYDTENDPHEIHNLVKLPKYQEVLDRMRAEQVDWMRETIDTGLLPEPELIARAGHDGIYAAVRKPDQALPLDRLNEVAIFQAKGTKGVEKLSGWMKDPDAAIRYWAVTGLGLVEEEMPQEPVKNQQPKPEPKTSTGKVAPPKPPEKKVALPDTAAQSARKVLVEALRDPAPSVRVAAARALLGRADDPAAMGVLIESLHDAEGTVRILAADALDNLGSRARPAVSALQESLHDSNQYVIRIANHALNVLLGTSNQVP